MRISDWSSDVCSSDLLGQGDRLPWPGAGRLDHSLGRQPAGGHGDHPGVLPGRHGTAVVGARPAARGGCAGAAARLTAACEATGGAWPLPLIARPGRGIDDLPACRMICAATEQRSEEHTSELQSLMRISYAVFCLKKKKTNNMMNK